MNMGDIEAAQDVVQAQAVNKRAARKPGKKKAAWR